MVVQLVDQREGRRRGVAGSSDSGATSSGSDASGDAASAGVTSSAGASSGVTAAAGGGGGGAISVPIRSDRCGSGGGWLWIRDRRMRDIQLYFALGGPR